MKLIGIRLGIVGVACCLAGTMALTQGQAPPATPPGADFLKRPPVARLSPEMQQKLFLLPPGYQIEPVLADPVIEDPVGVTFDGNGRMYVLEMRSYMQDADGSNSRAPISRISRHEDTDGDGTYDRHSVFADRLVLPRIAMPLQDGVLLVLETDNRDLYKYSDTDGDGVADRKDRFYAGFGRVTNMEWQPGGMAWALDNWMYSPYNPFRLRIAPDGKVLREETEVNGGQWGTNQDNYGKTWYVDGGSETGPVNFQTPIVYGAFNVPDNFEPDFQVPWPAPGSIADMQGGMNRVRLPDGTLNHFTSAAGPEIYRGDRLPQDLVGDLLFTEPVGRMVRRAKVVVTDGLTQLRNAYPQSEFVRSTDPLFRPVNVANGPDGTLYISDMYTGIIQDAQFVGPGSYLRRKVEQYELDKVHNFGRVWRITYEGTEPNRQRPRMYTETPAQLVAHLEHPNGWWRDTAQKLLVLKQDKSIVPALKTMAQTSNRQLGRIHALWTLEGLTSLDAPLARQLLKDRDPQIRIQAIRASESLYKASAAGKPFAADYRAMAADADPNVAIQAMLTLNLLKVPQFDAAIRATAAASTVRGVKEIGRQLLLPPQRALGQPASNDAGVGYLNLTSEERRIVLHGESIYREVCSSCHGPDGKGAPLASATAGALMAPPLAASPRVLGHRDYVVKVLLHGMTGPIDGQEFNGGAVMVPMGANTDDWISDVANYVRNAFGNAGRPYITPEQVAAARKSTTRKAPWTLAELERTVPARLDNQAEWTLSASHNNEAAANISAGTGRWDTGVAQQPGMWLQIELPEPVTMAELQIDSQAGGRGNGGLGGFGGLGVSPPATTPAPAGRAGAPAGAAGAAGRGAPGAGRGAGPAGAGRGAGGAGRGGGGRGRGGGPPAIGPVGYNVQLSMDGTTWSQPGAQGAGDTPTTIVMFRPTRAKVIRITQTGTAPNGELWAVQQVRIYRSRSSDPGR